MKLFSLSSLLVTLSSILMAVPPQAASLVRGDTPRNAPLPKHASPTAAPSSQRSACPAVCLPPTNYVSKKA